MYRLKRNTHHNPILQATWNKGQNRLKCEIIMVLVDANKKTLLSMEQIALDNSQVGDNKLCINILKIAGSHYGQKRSAKTIAKLRLVNKGRSPSPEAREKMRQAKLGKKLTDEHKAKISIKGKKINRPLGIKSSKRKLTADQVRYLRRCREFGWSWSRLAEKYQISVGVTRRIALGITYQDI